MSKRYFTSLISLILISCAPLGTRIRTFTSINNSPIKEIAIVITKLEWNNKSFGKMADSLFIFNIVNSVESTLHVNAKYVGFADDILSNSDEFLKGNSNYDAILHCEINLRGTATLDKSNRYNSYV